MKKTGLILTIIFAAGVLLSSCQQVRSACGMSKKSYKKKGKSVRKMGGGNMINFPAPTPTP